MSRKKPLNRMSSRELEAEATALIKAHEPLVLEPEEDESRIDSWQLAPMASECDCGDCDGCFIAEMFVTASGAAWRERLEVYAWEQSEGKAQRNREDIRETRAKDRLLAQAWRENEKAARREAVRGPRIRARDKYRKRDARKFARAVGFLFEGAERGRRVNVAPEAAAEESNQAADPTQLTLF